MMCTCGVRILYSLDLQQGLLPCQAAPSNHYYAYPVVEDKGELRQEQAFKPSGRSLLAKH
jgi:hypothetical protein